MRYLKTFFLQYHLIFLLRFNVKIFSSAVQKCPENGKNQKEIKWLLMALQKIFRFRWAFLFFEIFRWFFFQKIQHNFLHPNNELALFHLWTVALKIGPKVKQVGPKTKKNNTRLQWATTKILSPRVSSDWGATEKGVLTCHLISWSLSFGPIFAPKEPNYRKK